MSSLCVQVKDISGLRDIGIGVLKVSIGCRVHGYMRRIPERCGHRATGASFAGVMVGTVDSGAATWATTEESTTATAIPDMDIRVAAGMGIALPITAL